MRNDFKAQAETQGFVFKYGRKDFLNMIDNVEVGVVHLYLEPAKVTPLRSGTGAETGTEVSGKFMLLQKGNLDAMYDETLNGQSVHTEAKYQGIIEPLIPKLKSLIQGLENCGSDWDITYSFTEVINVDDLIMDGLLVTYNAKSL